MGARHLEAVLRHPAEIRGFVATHFKQRGGLIFKFRIDTNDSTPYRRIASSRNAPERTGHCLTRMLPSPSHIVNRVAENPLSCSIGEPAFPSRPGAAGAAARVPHDMRRFDIVPLTSPGLAIGAARFCRLLRGLGVTV